MVGEFAVAQRVLLVIWCVFFPSLPFSSLPLPEERELTQGIRNG